MTIIIDLAHFSYSPLDKNRYLSNLNSLTQKSPTHAKGTILCSPCLTFRIMSPANNQQRIRLCSVIRLENIRAASYKIETYPCISRNVKQFEEIHTLRKKNLASSHLKSIHAAENHKENTLCTATWRLEIGVMYEHEMRKVNALDGVNYCSKKRSSTGNGLQTEMRPPGLGQVAARLNVPLREENHIKGIRSDALERADSGG